MGLVNSGRSTPTSRKHYLFRPTAQVEEPPTPAHGGNGRRNSAVVEYDIYQYGSTISANASTLQVNGSTINGGRSRLRGFDLAVNTATIHGGSTLTNSAPGRSRRDRTAHWVERLTTPLAIDKIDNGAF